MRSLQKNNKATIVVLKCSGVWRVLSYSPPLTNAFTGLDSTGLGATTQDFHIEFPISGPTFQEGFSRVGTIQSQSLSRYQFAVNSNWASRLSEGWKFRCLRAFSQEADQLCAVASRILSGLKNDDRP